MSIVDVTQMWSKNGGSITSPKSDPLDQKYSITECYMVVCTVDTPISMIWDAAGIPLMGQQHSSGDPAFVVAKTPEQISPILWTVTVGYEGESADPESVDVEWSDVTSTEPVDRAFNGAAIVTANKEQVTGLTVELSDPVVIIRRRFRNINTKAIAAYRRATNSDTFLGWPAGTARLVGYSAKNRFKYNAPQEQWDVTARIQFREPFQGATAAQAWYKRWRHEGLLVKVGGVIQRAVDDKGQEMTTPVLLKADGTLETNENNALFVYTQVYGSLPYSALGLV